MFAIVRFNSSALIVPALIFLVYQLFTSFTRNLRGAILKAVFSACV